MSHQTNLALVPVAQNLPARFIPPTPGRSDPLRDPYALADKATRLNTSAEVERFLPDILGRALARCWIDPEFRARFCADARTTLAAHRIELPASIGVDVVTEGQTRPMVVVSERLPRSTQSRRLLYLQLVMVAGK